ncbi:Nucleolar protein 12 [Rhizina undulata]
MGKKDKSAKKAPVATKALDPSLASLFESSFGAVKAPVRPTRDAPSDKEEEDEEEEEEDVSEAEEISRSDGEDADVPVVPDADKKKRKRKRNDENDDLEDVYMRKLQESEAAGEKKREVKKTKNEEKDSEEKDSEEKDSEEEEGSEDDDDDDEGSEEEEGEEDDEEEENEEGKDSERKKEKEQFPIKHESLITPQATELDKSARTIFLGNVPSTAISSKTAYKTLKSHFSTAGKISSIRFRSIAFSEQIPRKAAFVTHKLHEKQQTVNAYVVYSTTAAARAALALNGSVVLDRHIRVDSVAHPAKQAVKKCVFIGNLDFEAQEESLWRHFGTCGKVESVRVVRDAKTNVGKGFAYVQFEDEMSVDSALLLDGKKMANDRKLRVSRAKAIKRSSNKPPSHSTSSIRGGPIKPRNNNPTSQTKARNPTTQQSVYVPKADPRKQALLGRANNLLGRAGASALKKQGEVFEGLRATAATDSGIKKGGSGKKKGKPRARASERSAAWKKQKGKEGGKK